MMNDRICIVTRQARRPEELIRFVRGPGDVIVPDLGRKLHGRGCWIGAEKELVRKAAAKNLFARALKMPAKAPSNLAEMVDSLLTSASLGALGLARKAGAIVLGAMRVETAVRGHNACAILHALEAAEDGIRKIAGARKAGARGVPVFKLFSESEMSLALGATNVIHAAVLDRGPGEAALRRLRTLAAFRGHIPAIPVSGVLDAGEDTE